MARWGSVSLTDGIRRHDVQRGLSLSGGGGPTVSDREVVVYVHGGNRKGRRSQNIVVGLGCVDVKSRGTLFEQGFMPDGDSAVIEVVGYNAERLCQVLQALERWAEKQGAELVFRWRFGSQ